MPTGDLETRRAYLRAHYQANRDKVLARYKVYYQANREKVRARYKVYSQANREKMAARKRAYNQANREKVVAQKKAYHKANLEKERHLNLTRTRRSRTKQRTQQLHAIISLTASPHR
jgi:hypothetical protein